MVAAPAAVMATAALASTLDSSAALLPSALKSEAGEHSAAPHRVPPVRTPGDVSGRVVKQCGA